MKHQYTQWGWEINTVLRIHGELCIREISELIDRPEARVSEAVRAYEDQGQLKRQRQAQRMVSQLI